MSQHASSVAHLHPRPPEPRPALHLVRTVSPRAPYVGLPTLFDLDAYSTVDTEAEQVRDGFLLAYRGHTLLACLLTLNGLRVSEACNASISDLNLSVKGHHTLTITRKGGKEAEIPLSARAFRNVIQAVDHRPDGPLLLDSLGHRMSRDAAARAVRLITKRAGIGKKIGPHALRHTFVSLGLDFGIPLRDMQTAAGHADPSTTTRYDRRDRDLDKHASYIVAAVIGS